MKYNRALKLHLLGWIDFELIKAGELVALSTLELAVRDRYLGKAKELQRAKAKIPNRKAPKDPSFADLLAYMVKKDGLTDDQIPLIARTGGTAIGRFVGNSQPSISKIRNGLAHGDPFDGLPYAGLLELVRDLIKYAYRDYLRLGQMPLA